jgi:hypothetical protein
MPVCRREHKAAAPLPPQGRTPRVDGRAEGAFRGALRLSLSCEALQFGLPLIIPVQVCEGVPLRPGIGNSGASDTNMQSWNCDSSGATDSHAAGRHSPESSLCHTG